MSEPQTSSPTVPWSVAAPILVAVLGLGAWWVWRDTTPPGPPAQPSQSSAATARATATAPAAPAGTAVADGTSATEPADLTRGPSDGGTLIAAPDGAMLAAPGGGAGGNSVPSGASLEDVISRVMPAVVLVETSIGRGSGFFVTRDLLLTNAHVVGTSGAESGVGSMVTLLRVGGARESARVTAVSPEVDVAVLTVTTPNPSQAVIALGSVSDARVGEEVIAIGSALGTLQNTVTRGIVSGLRQSNGTTLVQTDAAINPGNSGGPLLDREGRAIGITTMGYTQAQGLNFAVAIDHARAVINGRPPLSAIAMSGSAPATAAGASPASPVTGGATTNGSGANGGTGANGGNSGANGGMGANSADNVPGLMPAAQSPTDRAREDGERQLDQTLTGLSRTADGLDDMWRQFSGSCHQASGDRVRASGGDREWAVVLDDRAAAALGSALQPSCGTWLADMRRRAGALRADLAAADEAARRAGVFPGVRRDRVHAHRLDIEPR